MKISKKTTQMEKNKQIKTSKRLSYILRHNPESIDIQLDEYGWANVHEILQKLHLKFEDLFFVVQNNPKQRFKLNENNTKIRANQGHSIPVNLALKSSVPPTSLFHGTAIKNLESIHRQGIKKRSRHHVHLSSDVATAKKVGMRHGKPVVLIIDAKQMHEDGSKFYLSDNGVWLTDEVLPKYISS